ncbi:hypothetical protein ACFFJY_02230 [Fictibacillus aquaticus]|uniref:Uncharacterized protein n=1 Tax=Fictibacillus aquaticus TaxID=2021314 RepID=A0A235F8E9_9BACL|nr:hypothetical protein [Fictibacillus aquaticus]OYD57522.1 hypothetical protein CGZ90_12685 [Fictibacillus aquaticus]
MKSKMMKFAAAILALAVMLGAPAGSYAKEQSHSKKHEQQKKQEKKKKDDKKKKEKERKKKEEAKKKAKLKKQYTNKYRELNKKLVRIEYKVKSINEEIELYYAEEPAEEEEPPAEPAPETGTADSNSDDEDGENEDGDDEKDCDKEDEEESRYAEFNNKLVSLKKQLDQAKREMNKVAADAKKKGATLDASLIKAATDKYDSVKALIAESLTNLNNKEFGEPAAE